VNPLTETIETFGLAGVGTYLALFLAASLLIIWRLEALLRGGLEGTALGTLVMPYCSGLGNLIFVLIVIRDDLPAADILTNCVVNNVTNLTLVLAMPALAWGLTLGAPAKSASGKGRGKAAGAGDPESRLNRLSLLLTLGAGLFFTAITWVLGDDGRLDRNDGLALVGVFLFWQCFQVFDVLKHNIRERRSFGAWFYFDLGVVLLAAFALYTSIDWLVAWLSARPAGFVSGENLGWLSGWLMVLPNALLAFYYAAKGRADIVYASQVGDGHVCIPLCLGLAAIWRPLAIPGFFGTGVLILICAVLVHGISLLGANGLPRWLAWPLLAGYAWFVASGLG
jgi:cation:H+ antiporter